MARRSRLPLTCKGTTALARLLVIEDNRDLAELLAKGLERAGFTVDSIATAADAEHVLATNRYALVVLDLGLPDGDGSTVLRALRTRQDSTPVLILTARGGIQDRVKGLGEGADDYLAKPFAFEELVARIHALLRRPGEILGRSFKVGNVTFDTVGRQVFVDDAPEMLSARELAVLELLMRRSGRVVPKAHVEDHLYGLSGEVRSNAVEVCVHRLRKQLADVGATIHIHTVRGVGYLVSEERP
jgi:DNA-binding response OmpR family regulator